jgi:integrase
MLTNTEVKNLKIKTIIYYAKDSHGLRLQVNPCGSKIWQHRFRIKEEGKLKGKIRNAISEYPETSLQDAREWRDANKRLLKQGIIPPKVYNSITNDNQNKSTFKDLFDMWYANQKDGWTYDYAIDTQQRVDKHLLPLLGYKPITEINTKTMRDLLLGIQEKGTIDTLYKVKSIASRIFNYSIGMEISEINPVSNLPNDIFKKKLEKHYASVTEPKEIKWLLVMLKDVNSSLPVKIALDLAPHLLLRPEELAGLKWSEIDFKDRIIRISAERMKIKKKAHLIPMSNKVIEILTILRNANLDSTFCFPSARSKSRHITTSSLRLAIRSAGIDKETFTTHGFRHMGSTRLHELGYNKDVIESQLAHEIGGVRGVYNQAQYLEDRKVMMEDWSNYLDNLLTE